MKNHLQQFLQQLEMKNAPVKHLEIFVSMVGGFIAILLLYAVSLRFVDISVATMLVGSMGATAVLLFAIPHGALSQPWSVFGGHIISAIIGVSCAKWIPDTMLAASTAVGLSMGAMYYLKCIHPPGSATALTAVIGGETIHSLGYQFVITPVLLNACLIITIAVLYNALFSWRRYPHNLHRKLSPNNKSSHSSADYYDTISHADFVYALSQIDSFVDISEYDLLRIYSLATKKAHTRLFDVNKIFLNGYYSNGEYGDSWSVRLIVDEHHHDDPEKDLLIYKVVAGDQRRDSKTITRNAFARWAKHQVVQDNEQWKKSE